jgi:hypothetical protein
MEQDFCRNNIQQPRGACEMTDAVLMAFVPGTVVLALAIDLIALAGWLRRAASAATNHPAG